MEDKATYFITSDDDFIAANRAKEIFEELSKDAIDDMSKEIVECASSKVQDATDALSNALQAAATPSLFGGRKTVWLRGVNFLADSKILKNETVSIVLEKFINFLKDANPSDVAIVISASPVDRRSKLFKSFSTFANCEDYQAKDPMAACLEAITAEAKNLGVKFEYGAPETLASIVACNPRMCVQEVKKLATYTNCERPITEKDVVEMVPIFGEGDFFDISNAFFSGDLDLALSALKRYFFANKKASARPIITVLQKQNSLLIQLRSLMDSGDLSKTQGQQPKGAIERSADKYADAFAGAEEKSAYNVFSQNAWYAGSKLAPIAAKFPLKKLLDSQMNIVRAFEDLIKTGATDESVMRDFFVRTLSK